MHFAGFYLYNKRKINASKKVPRYGRKKKTGKLVDFFFLSARLTFERKLYSAIYIFYTLIYLVISMFLFICSCPFDWFNLSVTVSMHNFSIIVLGHPRYDKLARWRPSTITSQKSGYITQYSKQMPFFTSNQNILFLMSNLFVDNLFPLKISCPFCYAAWECIPYMVHPPSRDLTHRN